MRQCKDIRHDDEAASGRARKPVYDRFDFGVVMNASYDRNGR
jgi:hypothetical protein